MRGPMDSVPAPGQARRIHPIGVRIDVAASAGGLTSRISQASPAVRQQPLNVSNLPPQPTELIGRERECEEAGALVREHRLVTLVGPGGTGKTRLALQVAADAVKDFADGVFWVPLATTRTPDLVEPAVAKALGVTGSVAEALAAKNVLLLLDNFEQVVDAAPRLAELLAAAPAIKLLITSREPLRLASEWGYAVPTLSQKQALALFTERARAIQADFEPDEAVAGICRRLDGLPLAIELAAARVRALTPGQILERLGRSLDLLSARARDVPDRQQTLRATLDWSHELLVPEERTLFARLGVFLGGWTLDAAEAICDADLDTVESLVAKSLVKRAADRFSMLETIREYSIERLQTTSHADQLADRHAHFFLDLIEQAAPHLDEADQQTWSKRVSDEHDNVRAALDYFAAARASDLELRLAAAIWEFWFNRGLWHEARRAVERALASSSGVSPARARALNGAAWIAGRQGDSGVAMAFAAEDVRISREVGDARLLARALRRAAAIEYWSPAADPDRVHAQTEEAIDLARSVGDLRGLAAAVNNSGVWRRGAGDHRGAADRFEEALAIAREIGDRNGIVIGLVNIANTERQLGEHQQAQAHLRECLAVAREIGHREGVVETVNSLACSTAAVGDYGWTAALLGVAQREGDFGHVVSSTGTTAEELQTARSAAEEHLGRDRFETTLAAGRELTLDAVMDYLRDRDQPLPPMGTAGSDG